MSDRLNPLEYLSWIGGTVSALLAIPNTWIAWRLYQASKQSAPNLAAVVAEAQAHPEVVTATQQAVEKAASSLRSRLRVALLVSASLLGVAVAGAVIGLVAAMVPDFGEVAAVGGDRPTRTEPLGCDEGGCHSSDRWVMPHDARIDVQFEGLSRPRDVAGKARLIMQAFDCEPGGTVGWTAYVGGAQVAHGAVHSVSRPEFPIRSNQAFRVVAERLDRSDCTLDLRMDATISLEAPLRLP